jgi:hypothetical protein
MQAFYLFRFMGKFTTGIENKLTHNWLLAFPIAKTKIVDSLD